MADDNKHSGSKGRFRRLHEALRLRICLLDYPPGMRLSEEALAAEFGTSRTPLRRVLARLEDEGLVASRHGVGTFVTEVDMREMAHIYALRAELAGLVGRLAPVSVTPELRSRSRSFVARGQALCQHPDARNFARLNMDFFDFGLSLTDNRALRDISERLYYQTTRIWLKSIPGMDLEKEVSIFVEEIEQTTRAIESGDLVAAALIRQAHISMCHTRLATKAR